jgi:hypothetical protein
MTQTTLVTQTLALTEIFSHFQFFVLPGGANFFGSHHRVGHLLEIGNPDRDVVDDRGGGDLFDVYGFGDQNKNLLLTQVDIKASDNKELGRRKRKRKRW